MISSGGNVNNKELYKQEYLGIWNASNKEYMKAYKLWLNYYYFTEKYDRSFCSHFDKDGNAVPVTNAERKESNRFAREAMETLNFSRAVWECKNKTVIPLADWERAKEQTCRLSYEGMKAEYNSFE